MMYVRRTYIESIEFNARQETIIVSGRYTTPSDFSDAASETTTHDELSDLFRRIVERETAKSRTIVKRLKEAKSRSDERQMARMKLQLSQLDDARRHIARLQAVPFPLSLKHCNNCGEPFSEDEAIHVADDCGAVSLLQ
jgi:predicted nucleotidyltransferase